MKYLSIIIGIIVFSAFTFLVFALAADLGTSYDHEDQAELQTLSSNYEGVLNEQSSENSTYTQIQTELKNANADTIGIGLAVIKSSIDGVKLIFGSADTTADVIDMAAEDSGFIHPIIPTILKGLVAIVLVIIVLTVFLRMKLET